MSNLNEQMSKEVSLKDKEIQNLLISIVKRQIEEIESGNINVDTLHILNNMYNNAKEKIHEYLWDDKKFEWETIEFYQVIVDLIGDKPSRYLEMKAFW